MTTAAILLMGPTASGKSALALELARHFPVEIVSVDSAQVYRGMDIGTAKPDAATRAQVPHHLLDLIDPTESYSAARFCDDALAAMHGIVARGRVPLLVGGTMLYFKALREGLSALPQANAELRAEITEQAAREGWPALHAELARVDRETAARLDPNDSQRIERALEIYRVSGEPMSALLARAQATETARDAAFRYVPIALLPSDRAVLHQRIAQRFDAMLAAGLVEEVAQLRARYALAPEMPSMRCVGYRQAWQHLDGEYYRTELRERGIYATRQLAKRQLTWLRQTQAEHFECLAADVATSVQKHIEQVLI
jgi:tRNA dimethylallyltransferase